MDTDSAIANFFNQFPQHLSTLCDGYPSHNPSNIVVWEAIFTFVYGEMPQSAPEHPENWRPGSTDPRWDTLLLQSGYGFMKAVHSFVEVHMSQQLNKEAA